jgi:hypothetical protein
VRQESVCPNTGELALPAVGGPQRFPAAAAASPASQSDLPLPAHQASLTWLQRHTASLSTALGAQTDDFAEGHRASGQQAATGLGWHRSGMTAGRGSQVMDRGAGVGRHVSANMLHGVPDGVSDKVSVGHCDRGIRDAEGSFESVWSDVSDPTGDARQKSIEHVRCKLLTPAPCCAAA